MRSPLVGAQAVHLRTAAGELTTPSYTSDADLGVDPVILGGEPLLEQIPRRTLDHSTFALCCELGGGDRSRRATS